MELEPSRKVCDREDACATRKTLQPCNPSTFCDFYSQTTGRDVRRRIDRGSVAANQRRGVTRGSDSGGDQLLRKSEIHWTTAQNARVGSFCSAGFCRAD